MFVPRCAKKTLKVPEWRVHNEEEGLSDLSVRAMRYPTPVHSYVDLNSGDSRVCRVLAPLSAALGHTQTHTQSRFLPLRITEDLTDLLYIYSIFAFPEPSSEFWNDIGQFWFYFASLTLRYSSCTVAALVCNSRLSIHISLLNKNTFFTVGYIPQPEHQQATVRSFCRRKHGLAPFPYAMEKLYIWDTV